MKENNTKLALVVGGSGDIGKTIVSKLVHDGFQVYSTYYNNKPKKVKNVICVKCDLTNNGNIVKLIKNIYKQNNSIDVIVFTASLPIEYKQIFDVNWNEIENHFRIQVFSLFEIIKLLKPQFQIKHKTKIIVILTEMVIGKPPKGFADYIISKYAALGLSKVLAIELANYNTTVNMITPGMVETKLIDNLPPKIIEMVAYNNPLKRITTTKDIANVISFLSSEESDYLNGVNIPINGGNSLL